MTKQTNKECDEFRNGEIEIERTIQNEAAQQMKEQNKRERTNQNGKHTAYRETKYITINNETKKMERDEMRKNEKGWDKAIKNETERNRKEY